MRTQLNPRNLPGLWAVRGTNQRTHALSLESLCGVPHIAGPRRSEWSHEEGKRRADSRVVHAHMEVCEYVLVQCIAFISPGAAESSLPLYFPLVTHTSPSSALIYLVSATSFSHSLFSLFSPPPDQSYLRPPSCVL